MKLDINFLKSDTSKEFFSDTWIRWVVAGIVVLLITSWIYMVISFSDIPDRIILHIDSNRVVDVVGARIGLYGIAIVWSVMIVLDIVLAGIVYARNKRGGYALAYGALMIVVLFLLYAHLIVSINK